VSRFTRHDHTIETISAAWLLPIVSSVVAAASGGVVSTALAPFDPALARSTVIVSYVVWGTGVPLAMFIITLWIYRSALSGTPTSGAFCSVFLPLGPCGQGSFGIMTLSNVVRTLAYTYDVGLTVTPEGVSCSTSIQRVADAVYAGGMVTGMVLWGLGLCWYILAFAMVLDHVLKNRDFFFLSKFSVGFWAITFPIGYVHLKLRRSRQSLAVGGSLIRPQSVRYCDDDARQRAPLAGVQGYRHHPLRTGRAALAVCQLHDHL
jgi:tellurite resistance protein TehA-like permease